MAEFNKNETIGVTIFITLVACAFIYGATTVVYSFGKQSVFDSCTSQYYIYRSYYGKMYTCSFEEIPKDAD